MTTRDDVTAALAEAANHRQLKADLINNITGDVIHANTCVVCLMDWPCTSAALSGEVERLREENAVLHRQQVRLLGLAATHGPAGTTDEEA